MTARFALGTAPLGLYPDQVDAATAQHCLQRAAELGIRYFDTAPFYGAGLAEQRLGAFLTGRTGLTVSTKVGRSVVDGGTTVFDFSRDGVRRQFEQSLRRLGTDKIDMVYLHDPDDHWATAIDEAWPALRELRDSGAVAAVGAGMNQTAMLLRFVRETDMDVILLANRYTLLQQYEADELFAACAERGVRVVLGAPLNGGILATGTRPGAHFLYRPPTPDILDRVARLETACLRHGVPLVAAALQFAAAHPGAESVLLGAKTAAEVAGNLAAAALPVPAAFWAELIDLGLLGADRPLPA